MSVSFFTSLFTYCASSWTLMSLCYEFYIPFFLSLRDPLCAWKQRRCFQLPNDLSRVGLPDIDSPKVSMCLRRWSLSWLDAFQAHWKFRCNLACQSSMTVTSVQLKNIKEHSPIRLTFKALYLSENFADRSFSIVFKNYSKNVIHVISAI